MPDHLSLQRGMISRLSYTSYRIMRASVELDLQIKENFLQISLKILMSHVLFYILCAGGCPLGKHYLFANDNFTGTRHFVHLIFLLYWDVYMYVNSRQSRILEPYIRHFAFVYEKFYVHYILCACESEVKLNDFCCDMIYLL